MKKVLIIIGALMIVSGTVTDLTYISLIGIFTLIAAVIVGISGVEDPKRMKVVYIAHPIGGDVDNNVARVLAIVRRLNLSSSEILPFAPYLVDVMALEDTIPEQRARGFLNNRHFFTEGYVDEVWVYGLSNDVRTEIGWAEEFGIPVVYECEMP